MADLLEYIFNPSNKLAVDWRWRGFFYHQMTVQKILSDWSSKRNSKTGLTLIHNWALDLVQNIVQDESNHITKSGNLGY